MPHMTLLIDHFASRLIFSSDPNHVWLLSGTGLPQDVRSASAGDVQSECWVHVTFRLVYIHLQECIICLRFVMLWTYVNPCMCQKFSVVTHITQRLWYQYLYYCWFKSQLVSLSSMFQLLWVSCCVLFCSHSFLSGIDSGKSSFDSRPSHCWGLLGEGDIDSWAASVKMTNDFDALILSVYFFCLFVGKIPFIHVGNQVVSELGPIVQFTKAKVCIITYVKAFYFTVVDVDIFFQEYYLWREVKRGFVSWSLVFW